MTSLTSARARGGVEPGLVSASSTPCFSCVSVTVGKGISELLPLVGLTAVHRPRPPRVPTSGLRLQARKVPEVPVGRPQFTHPVLLAQGRDAGVVYCGPEHPGLGDQGAQPGPVTRRFGQQHQAGALQPSVDLVKRKLRPRRRAIDARVGARTCEAKIGTDAE